MRNRSLGLTVSGSASCSSMFSCKFSSGDMSKWWHTESTHTNQKAPDFSGAFWLD